MSQLNMSEIIINAFINALFIVLPFFKPYIFAAIAGLFIYAIIKWIVYPYYIMAGYSKREAKKRVKIAQNLVDLISNANNISNK